MKICIAQLGGSSDFQQPFVFGCKDIAMLLIQLAKIRPNDTFYWGSTARNLDVKDKVLFPNQNVIYALEGIKKSNLSGKELRDVVNVNLPKDIDLFIVVAGPTHRVTNSIDTIKFPNGTYRKTLLMFARYSGPTIHAINERPNAKVIALTNDSRSALLDCKDLLRRPELHLAQTTWENVPLTHFTSYDDLTEIRTTTSAMYFPIESFYLLGEPVPHKPEAKLRGGFGLVLNEGSDKSGAGRALRRLPILQEWVLANPDPTIEVYGKWKPEIIASDPRMKGFILMNDLYEKLKKWKYSLCIPIQRGWTTTKYIELVQSGVVPFLHPFYDEKHLVDFPEILRVSSPKELQDRIAFLDSDEAAYNQLWDELYELVFKPELIDGSAINEIVDFVLES